MKKAFTLIELLIVISIIGILASVILAATSNIQKRAADAVIMQTTSSMMSAAQSYSIETGDYNVWQQTAGSNNRLSTNTDCEDNIITTNPLRDQMVAACKEVIKYGGWIWFSSYYEDAYPSTWIYPKFSIGVLLPGADKVYCIGSNGRKSATTEPDGTGCGSTTTFTWVCPGCGHDPLGN